MNTFGRAFRITIFGESHGKTIGIVIDGVPAGIPISENIFSEDIEKRKPKSIGTTSRKEEDIPNIISGVFEGCTTGTAIVITFENNNTISTDYAKFREIPRPGHSDFTASTKYNFFNDIRGGGQFSGRLTLCLVVAGVIAKEIIKGIDCKASIIEIGGEKDIHKQEHKIKEAEKNGDSLGGIIECRCSGLPIGLGEPYFDSIESIISHLAFSIPGVRGVEFGDGFIASKMLGSEHNDRYINNEGNTSTNGAGGINGGISNGNDIIFRVAFKPTSSISKAQTTFNFIKEELENLSIEGRHDVCFAIRTPIIVEAIAAIALADFSLLVR